jgi:glycosyltransferase involved in cell wall biosynthesis
MRHFVRFPGWLPTAELEALYDAAAGVVLPSLYEGFGFPALEALKRGIPLACSRGGAMAELVQNAAMTFDPLDVSEITHCLHRLLSDAEEADRLRSAGMRRAACFSWDRTARQTLESYFKALDSPVPTEMDSTG